MNTKKQSQSIESSGTGETEDGRFETIKRQLTNNRFIAILLIVGLVIVEIGHFATGLSESGKLANLIASSITQQRKLAAYDEHLTSGLIDLFREIMIFTHAYELKAPELSTLEARKLKYEDFDGRLDVLRSIAAAQENNELTVKMVQTLTEIVRILEQVDARQGTASSAFISEHREQMLSAFTMLLRSEYLKKKSPKNSD